MKTLFALIAVCFALNAQAASVPVGARLTTIDLDPKLELSNVSGASIEVNENDKTVTLTVNFTNYCAPHGFCSFAIRAPETITLPIVSVKTDSCQVPHIIAKRDLRTTDGDLEQLEVVDNSKSKCMYATNPAIHPDFTFPSETIVTYTTDGFDNINHRGSIQTSSHFEGGQLSPISK